MKLNLGCGNDLKKDYINVDFRDLPGVFKADLSQFPYPWKDSEVDHVLMFDFLEHFSYRITDKILTEVWRILKPEGYVEIQVPDFEQCAKAILNLTPYICNVCERPIIFQMGDSKHCDSCGTNINKVAEAGLARLFGGQDYQGNWHNTTFTRKTLLLKLTKNGFGNFQWLEDENDYQRKNWNMKVRAYKNQELWSEE